MSSFEASLAALDAGLFQYVPSQTFAEDKKSLLALQAAVRAQHPSYVYLEIGSFMGGSLQPHLMDDRCGQIISIDQRRGVYPDVRETTAYANNTTAHMLEHLGRVPGGDLKKIRSIDGSTDAIAPGSVGATPDLCFIDGEHTDEAVVRDGLFCLSVVDADGCLVFHDANLVFKGLDRFIGELVKKNVRFRPYVLPETLFVVDLGAAGYRDTEPVSLRRAENYKAYLSGLKSNDWYREAYNQPVYRFLRRIRAFFPKF